VIATAEDLREDASRVLMTSIEAARTCGPNTMTGFRGLERVHRGVEAALVAPPPLEPNRTARGTTTTDRPLEMQTQSTIHIDSLVPGVFPKPVRVEVDRADAERIIETATVTGTTEPAPSPEVLAEAGPPRARGGVGGGLGPAVDEGDLARGGRGVAGGTRAGPATAGSLSLIGSVEVILAVP
jgi:hypothetical protein